MFDFDDDLFQMLALVLILITAVVVIGIVSGTIGSVQKRSAIGAMVRGGVDPIRARCAFAGSAGQDILCAGLD